MKAIDPAALAALDAGRFGVRALCLFDLPSGRFGMVDDQYDIAWGGDTYVGAAGRLSFQLPPLAADMSVRGLTVILSSLDAAVLAWVQDQSYQQRPMFAAVAILSETGAVLSVKRWFTGFVDQVTWQERIDGESRLVVKCESVSRELDRAGARTRSDADQRTIDASDGFFKHTVNATATEIEWGQIPPSAPKKKPWYQFW